MDTVLREIKDILCFLRDLYQSPSQNRCYQGCPWDYKELDTTEQFPHTKVARISKQKYRMPT